MFIKEIRSSTFPVGSGSLELDMGRILQYTSSMVKTNADAPPQAQLPDSSHAPLGKQKTPSHKEMIAALCPEGNPEMIILSYWLPDMDFNGGESLVAALSEEYSGSKAYTFALCDTGFGALPSALEYIKNEMSVNKQNEIWLFYLNQFQYGAPGNSELFWVAPGESLWIKLVRDNEKYSYPKLSIERRIADDSEPALLSMSDEWDEQSSAIKSLINLTSGDDWKYSYRNKYNNLCFDMTASYV